MGKHHLWKPPLSCTFLSIGNVRIHVTSCSSISYWSNSEYWSQKRTQSGNIYSILNIFRLLFIGLQGRVDVKFQSEVKTLMHIITENRNRSANGPFHFFPLILLHKYVTKNFEVIIKANMELKELRRCLNTKSKISYFHLDLILTFLIS